MKEILAIIIILLTQGFYPALGQITFQKTYGGGDQDVGFSVQQTNDKGYIVAGTTKSFMETQGGIYLIRTNSGGDTLWTKTYGGINNWEDAASVQQTNAGGFIFTGGAASFGNGGEDVYVVEVDSNGSPEWSKTIGGSADDRGNGIERTIDGNYIITGSTVSFGAGGNDVYLIKLDSNGNILWTRTFGDINDDYGKVVKQTSDSGYVILAESYTDGVNHLLLIKTDRDADLIWSESLEGRYGNSIAQTQDGGYAITGGVVDTDLTMDMFLYKVNSAGTLVWAKTYGSHIGQSLLETADDGFILMGDSSDIVKTDNGGNVIWAKRYGAPGIQNLSRNICQTKDHGCIITGSKNMLTHDYDLLLFKADSLGKSGCTDVSITRIARDFLPQIVDQTIRDSSGGILTNPSTHMNKVGTLVQTLGKPVSNFSYYTDTTATIILYNTSLNELSWDWNFGDGTSDSIHSTISHTFADSGSYNVCLTAKNSCGSDTYCRVFTFTKPGGVEKKNQYLVNVYPDPASEFIIIEVQNKLKQDLSLNIYNSIGQQVFQRSHISGNQIRINRECLPSGGLYFFRIQDPKGIVGTGKFILE